MGGGGVRLLLSKYLVPRRGLDSMTSVLGTNLFFFFFFLYFLFFQTALVGGATALDLAQLLRGQWAQFLRGNQQ